MSKLFIRHTVDVSDLCDALDDTPYDDVREFFKAFAEKLALHDSVLAEIAYAALKRVQPERAATSSQDQGEKK